MRIAYCKRITKKGMEKKRNASHKQRNKNKMLVRMDQSRWTDISMRLPRTFRPGKKLAGTLGVHDDRTMRNPELLLEQHGWVKVTKDPFGPTEKLRSAILASRMYITRTQAKTLADLGFDQNHDYLDLVEMSEMRWAA